MFLHPDLDTFAILPWRPQQGKVARLICDVYDREGNLYAKSSRTILQKVIFEAKAMGYEFEISPECEFFLFHTDEDGGATSVTHDKGGYLDLGPLDLGENARRDMVLTLEEMGIDVESSFHEVAAGQHELDFCPAAALRTADQLMTAKFAIRTIANVMAFTQPLCQNQKPEFTDRVFIFPSPCFRREKMCLPTNPMNTGSAKRHITLWAD